ncbi:GntR family transcriptional regulator [Oceanibacterium hippocampi]|uniref:Putative HTH-type transcriptional regulator YdfH n=1 Tax=Oceanibacterium hippocampi TaxID=745714 RepID=A0A1Y5TS87_9PROT|nr:GntR family transcriptional regulator [Oceanibacterium hippocampi]SLN71126.1 putative HTH-type transcriptional regulator YdfH [Oceanibacterium hippocampi]
MNAKEPITPLAEGRTVVDLVADALRRRIIRGEMAPGSKLSQDKLAESFGVSRIPVREALRQLSAEGLVELHSHRSAMVCELDPEGMLELVAVAGSLEALAAERGVPLLSRADLDEMAALLARMKENVSDPAEWYQDNMCFHLIVTRASGWKRAFGIIREARLNLMRYMNQSALHPTLVAGWDADHRQIFEACRQGDQVQVRLLLDLHWRKSAREIHNRLTSDQNVEPGEAGFLNRPFVSGGTS